MDPNFKIDSEGRLSKVLKTFTGDYYIVLSK